MTHESSLMKSAAKDYPPNESDLLKRGVRNLFADVTVEQEDTDDMENAVFLIPNLIVSGSVTNIIAPANAGKTALMAWAASEMAKHCEVIYVNVDANSDYLIWQREHAENHGYALVSPDAKKGSTSSIKDVMRKLRVMAESEESFAGVVIILDTLKKFCDMMDKNAAKDFYNVARSLSTKGCTLVQLGHTNKNAGLDGKPVFEGTGEHRNDVDNLLYISYSKNEANRTQDITTAPDKVRARFDPCSFRLHLDERSVEPLSEVVAIVSADDRQINEAVREAIIAGCHNQKEIITRVKDSTSFSPKKIRNNLSSALYGKHPTCIARKKGGAGKELMYSLRASDPAWGDPI